MMGLQCGFGGLAWGGGSSWSHCALVKTPLSDENSNKVMFSFLKRNNCCNFLLFCVLRRATEAFPERSRLEGKLSMPRPVVTGKALACALLCSLGRRELVGK